jgi:hypothetical protein
VAVGAARVVRAGSGPDCGATTSRTYYLTLTRHEQNALVRLKSPYNTLSIPLNDFTPITMSKINQPSNQIK